MEILSDKIVTTRKKYNCSACGRLFEEGVKMRTQVNTYDGIGTWRACMACDKLITNYPEHFEDNYDGSFPEGCVSEALERGQTPEELLSLLENVL